MSTQLREVLNRFASQKGPISISRMAQEMAIDPGVLHGMIDYWVRKGKLREVSGAGQHCHTCGGKTGCPFIVPMPRAYELVQEGETSPAPSCGCGAMPKD